MTEDQITEALITELTTELSPGARERHLAQIREVASQVDDELARHDNRLTDLELFKAQATLQIVNLTEQVRALTEERKAAERDEYVDLRRALLVIGLTELMAEEGYLDAEEMDKPMWLGLTWELFRRYGHLEAGGKRLWTKPPEPPSEATKALIAEVLQRRQEA